MVRLTRIYTRVGDRGRTALGDGVMVDKHHPRVAAYGGVDEANAAIGLVRLALKRDRKTDALLLRIQNDLFDLGADLCTPETGRRGQGALRVTEAQVAWLERAIDRVNAGLKPLDSFVLPGGSPASSYLHLARTVTRRAERAITALMAREKVNPAALKYVNRLSDLLFVLARHCNARGKLDVLWVPGANR